MEAKPGLQNPYGYRILLTAKAVERAALPLEGIDNIHGGDGLPASMLGVGDSIADDVLKEDLEDSTGLLIDEAADPLHPSTAGEAADSWLGDPLDVVPEHLAVTLGPSFPQSLPSLSSSRHSFTASSSSSWEIISAFVKSSSPSPFIFTTLMLQQSRPMTHQLLIPIRFAHRNPFAEMISGTVSPLERNPQSPKGWKNRESDGIGLGIVVALLKSDGRRGPENFTSATPIRSASSLISIGCPRDELRCSWSCCGDSGLDDYEHNAGDLRAFRPADFLSDCYLCRKNLQGKDIYMYRGEKAFCSMECRCQQIMSDEFQEKCRSEALRSSEISSSPYTDDRLFFMGITAS